MVSIAVVSMSITDFLTSGSDKSVCQPQTIVWVVIGIGIASFVVYRLDESHFGIRGAVRWVIFGIVSVLMLLLQSAVRPHIQSWVSLLKTPWLRHLFDWLVEAALLDDGILSLILSYCFVFVPFRLQESNRE